MSSLAEHLDSALPQDAEQRERFSIETRDQASWALRKIGHIEKQLADNKRLADAERAKIEDWEKGEAESLNREKDYFTSLLASYHMALLVGDPKARTIRLPYGLLKCRKQQPEFVRDETALLTWVKANQPDFIKVKESVDWAEFKKLTALAEPEGINAQVVDTTTGMIVEGVTAIIRPDKFEVEVIKE